MQRGTVNCVSEWSYKSAKEHADPFNELKLDVLIAGPRGQEWRVPAFWSGGGNWRARFAPPEPGRYTLRSTCSDTSDSGLHGVEGELEAGIYQGDNALLQHGPLSVHDSRRYLVHADGTPFLWLGDTWWMGLCKRLKWPEGFETLLADRVRKGFSVIQIIAGLYPDMPWRDERGANEFGYPWEQDFSRIVPEYWDLADQRIAALVDAGLVPCIVGCWGYFLPWMGVERLKQHWRYLVARYGAYPVVWCLAGEATMPYYLSQTREQDMALQKSGWTEIAAYVRALDPCRRPLTIHPTSVGRDQIEDDSLLDINWLQTGHGGRDSVPNTVNLINSEFAREPRMPVINSEVCYEGIMESSREEIQRFMFWACMLSGACGHTYGANGIWQVNEPGRPYGPSPHGLSWGDRPWTEAYQLPGSGQLGLGKQFLAGLPWWRLQPCPELVEPHWTPERHWHPFAAWVPGELWVIYVPTNWFLAPGETPIVKQLDPTESYRAFYLNPSDGSRRDLGSFTPDPDGNWLAPMPNILRDWVLVVERR